MRAGLELVGFDRSSAQLILDDLGSHWRRLGGALAASAVAPLSELGFISVVYWMVAPAGTFDLPVIGDSIGAGMPPFAGGTGTLTACGLFLLALTVGLKCVSGLAHAEFKERSAALQSHRIIEAVLCAPPHLSGRIDRARVANLAIYEAGSYGQAVYLVLETVASAAGAAAFLATLLFAAPVVLAISAVLAAAMLAITTWGSDRRRAITGFRVEADARLTSRLWEILNGHQTIKVEGGEPRQARQFRAAADERHLWRERKLKTELAMRIGTEAAIYLALLIIVVVSTVILDLAPALLLVFLVMMSRLQRYASRLQVSWLALQFTTPVLRTLSEELERYQPVGRLVEPAAAGPRPAAIHLQMDRVSFEYDPGARVLEDVTLDLNPGERVLVQGPSGEGKSTLLYLACGLLAPSSGRIVINGEPLTADLFYRLRPSIAYVAPNGYLFAGSVRENLCVGVDYPDAEIRDVVARARLQSVVSRLPGGLDGGIGENGAHLSLGERQRVMLARLFLKRPLLVLLDEATANLDRDGEQAIFSSLMENLDPLATVIVVTHREPRGIDFTRSYDLRGGRLSQRSMAMSRAGDALLT
jgi:ABC-type bacteriocin/lantibiotic exporter with double-glycine peptidase domain